MKAKRKYYSIVSFIFCLLNADLNLVLFFASPTLTQLSCTAHIFGLFVLESPEFP